MVRTRTDAAALTTAGFVRLNGKRMTAAAHPVRIGDVVTLALDRSVSATARQAAMLSLGWTANLPAPASSPPR